MGCGGRGNTVTGIDRVKTVRFIGSLSWTMFHHQSEAVLGHNNWAPQEKGMHLLDVLQGKLPIFYTVSLQKQHTNTLVTHMRVAMGTTNWPWHTIPSRKQGPNLPVSLYKDLQSPSSSCSTGPLLDSLNTLSTGQQLMYLLMG